MIVEPLEIPDVPGEDPEEDPRVWHEAAQLYLARALDGFRTQDNAHLAAANLRRVLDHALVASWPYARAIATHDLGLASLLAAETSRGERERRLVRTAVERLESACEVLEAAAPARVRGIALHNLGYARERLATLEEDDRLADAAHRTLAQSRLIRGLVGA